MTGRKFAIAMVVLIVMCADNIGADGNVGLDARFGQNGDHDASKFPRPAWESHFPVPTVQNVYKAWKPVDSGHPFRDATIFYAPPTLERVKILGQSKNNRRLEHARSGEFAFESTQNVVIPADRTQSEQSSGYSVYGSPDINYSELYAKDNAKLPTHDQPLPEARSSPYNEFTSRFDDRRDVRRGHDHGRVHRGGGFQYMDPPNRGQSEFEDVSNDVEEEERGRGAVIYSFRHGDSRRAVGVVYGNEHNNNAPSKPYRALNLAKNQRPPTMRPKIEEPNHQTLVSGHLNHVRHDQHGHVIKAIDQRDRQDRRTEIRPSFASASPFPLGTPWSRSQVLTESRRSSAPKRLEGVLGPRTPTKPEPTKIFLQDDDNVDVNAGRAEFGNNVKRMRDMDYSRPAVIMRVKESGELYRPEEKEIIEKQWEPKEQYNTNDHYYNRDDTRFNHDLRPDDSHKKLIVYTKRNDNNERREEQRIRNDPQQYQKGNDEDSKEHLYELCLREVPPYLRHRLCHHLLDESRPKRLRPLRQEVDDNDIKREEISQNDEIRENDEFESNNGVEAEQETLPKAEFEEDQVKMQEERKQMLNKHQSMPSRSTTTTTTTTTTRLSLELPKLERSPTSKVISPRPTLIHTHSKVKIYGAKKDNNTFKSKTRTTSTTTTSTSTTTTSTTTTTTSTTTSTTTRTIKRTSSSPKTTLTEVRATSGRPASTIDTEQRDSHDNSEKMKNSTDSSINEKPKRRRGPSPFLLGLTKFLTQRFLKPSPPKT